MQSTPEYRTFNTKAISCFQHGLTHTEYTRKTLESKQFPRIFSLDFQETMKKSGEFCQSRKVRTM